jgi:hypothetical protein
MPFERITEEKIKEAMEQGEFDNLPGQGKPLDLSDYFAAPSDLRLAFSALKSAGLAPEEVELAKEIEQLRAELEACADPRRQTQLKREIDGKVLKLNLLLDARRRRGR